MAVRVRDLTARLRRFDPLWLDVLVAIVCFGICVSQISSAPHERFRVAQLVITALLAAALAVRRRVLLAMLFVLLVAIASVIALDGVHAAHGPGGVAGSLMGLLLFYGGGAYLTERWSLLGLAAGLAITTQGVLGSGREVVANLLWASLVIGVLPWFLGRTMRERTAQARADRERAERLDAEREMHVRVAALAERARLAREIHDVIAHSVSVMVIQAGGARTVMDNEPARAEDALLSVERAGREALAEMRRLLGVLGDGRRLRELAPQPGIDDLDELATRTQAAGLRTSVSVVGEPVVVSPGLSLCAYRVVQEALTNAIKHAGAERAEVSVKWGVDSLELEIADDGSGKATAVAVDRPPESAGHGIIGMCERIALHGGVVEAGPRPAGGFAVRVRIPLALEGVR